MWLNSKNQREEKQELSLVDNIDDESLQLFKALRLDDRDSLHERYFGVDSPLADTSDTYIMCGLGMKALMAQGVITVDNNFLSLLKLKGSFYYSLTNSPRHIATNLLNGMLWQFIDIEDFQYSESLVEYARDAQLKIDHTDIFYRLLRDLRQSMSDVDFDEEIDYINMIMSRWSHIIAVLNLAGLPRNLDVGEILVQFVPEFDGEDIFYLCLLTMFKEEGFSFQDMPDTENETYKEFLHTSKNIK